MTAPMPAAGRRNSTAPVLLWAAGLDVPPPDGLILDEDLLLAMVDRHALAGRLLRRLQVSPPPPWATSSVLSRLAALYDETRARLCLHTEAAAQIVAEFSASSQPVLIKGISTYLVTGAAHTVRCGDIDLVCSDGDRMIEVLTGLGYHRTRDPFMHEVGEFTREETEIDVHAHFPVHGYTGLDRSGLDPTAFPGVWHQMGYRMSVCEVDWTDLDRGRIRTPDGAPAGVSVPDPCMMAIILCAHAFMNFTNIWSISHREKPYVRLGELADLQDLAKHPAFDSGRFLRMVSEFGASDAVHWASWASRVLIGWNPLPEVRGGGPSERFPRCLWWSFWTDVPVDLDTMLWPGWLDMATLVGALGPSAVGLGRRLHVNDLAELPRQLRLSTGTRAPSWSIQVSDLGRTVAIWLPSRPDAEIERVRVDFGSNATEWSLVTKTGHQSVMGDQISCDLREDESGQRLELRYDSVTLSPASMIIGISDEDSHGNLTRSVLLPLTIWPGT